MQSKGRKKKSSVLFLVHITGLIVIPLHGSCRTITALRGNSDYAPSLQPQGSHGTILLNTDIWNHLKAKQQTLTTTYMHVMWAGTKCLNVPVEAIFNEADDQESVRPSWTLERYKNLCTC